MAVEAVLAAGSHPRALARGLTARVGLCAIVAVSCAVRVVAGALHTTPRYLPDEYIYTAIARSLAGEGKPLVRGAPAHFPALLEPLLAAPLWRFFDPAVAYRLVQAENALAMSLAAVPVYLLARRLSLSAPYALASAAFAVALPDLVYSGFTLADPIAYPLVLGAVAAGVWALETRAARAQVLFVALAGLATFARVQYVVLPVAFGVAAIVVERRRVLRAQALPLGLFAVPVAGALAVGPSRLLGYYAGVANLHVGGQIARWAAVDLFLLALVAGVVLVPGALVGLATVRGRVETGFAVLVVALAGGLLAEAGLYAANGSSRFQERYLFALLPLVPVAFGLYVKHGRPWRLGVAGISAVLVVLAARVPLSGYSTAAGKTDSPFLFAVSRLEHALGTANASLIVAGLASLAALGALAVAWRGGGARFAIGATVALAAVSSVGAIATDAASSREIRRTHLPANLSWVDAARLGSVTAVQTAGSPPDRLLEQLFWNRTVTREVRLGAALPTDVFPSPRVRIGRDGTLRGVRGVVLFQSFGATATFDDADLAARAGSFDLWRPLGAPRLRSLMEGRYRDGWLARSGRLTVYPDASGRTRGVVRFTVSLPAGAQPVTVRFGGVAYDLEPDASITMRYRIDRRGPWTLPFHSVGGSIRDDLRPVSARATAPRFERAGEATRAASSYAA